MWGCLEPSNQSQKSNLDLLTDSLSLSCHYLNARHDQPNSSIGIRFDFEALQLAFSVLVPPLVRCTASYMVDDLCLFFLPNRLIKQMVLRSIACLCFCFTAFTDQIRAPFLASSVEYQFQEHLPVRASVNIRESNPAVASCDASWHATRFQSRETHDGAICPSHVTAKY